MKLKSTILAVLAGTAALAALPASAHDGWNDRGWHRGHRHAYPHYGYYSPRPVVVVPAPVVVPPRVVYVPAPRYYYRPAPVYAPTPVYPSSGISIRFTLPL